MAYEWTQLGIREITNLYLYGQINTPADLTDENLIRGPGQGDPVKVIMSSFMSTGPGRFALGSLSPLVQTFFAPGVDRSWMETDRAYSVEEIKSELTERGESLPKVSENFSIRQVELADGTNDHLVRAYVWNNGLFRLSLGATFVKDASGNLRIDNYQIRVFHDGFDFVGGGDLAALSNAVLQPRIDPSKLGRASR